MDYPETMNVAGGHMRSWLVLSGLAMMGANLLTGCTCAEPDAIVTSDLIDEKGPIYPDLPNNTDSNSNAIEQHEDESGPNPEKQRRDDVPNLDVSQLESVCGNGVIESGEECDDGNQTDDDACTLQCKPCSAPEETASVCGNGIVEKGEACDDGNACDSDACTSLCELSPSLSVSD